jgi:hypothetical protein
MRNGVQNTSPKDRWGNTPLDDAIRGNFEEIVQMMKRKDAKTGIEINNI